MISTLVEELGSSGIMDVTDIQDGMSVSLKLSNDDSEHKGVISDVTGHVLTITFENKDISSLAGICDVSIVVDNTTYHWKNASILRTQNYTVSVQVEGKPQVANRRKFPRLGLTNPCKITLKSGNIKAGNMLNISANGMAFTVSDNDITMGELLKVHINDFAIRKTLSAVAIRKAVLSDDSIQYSCRLLDDDMDIAAYVESKLK